MLKFIQDSEYIRVFKDNLPLVIFSRFLQIFYDKYGNSESKSYFSACMRFRVRTNLNTDLTSHFTSFYQSRSDFFSALNNNPILSYSDDSSFLSVISLKTNPTVISDGSLYSSLDLNFSAAIPVAYSAFYTDLYEELLDNSEQFQLAKSFLNDTDPSKELDPTYWTDTQLKFFNFVEEYNKNVLLLRSTRKVEIDKEIFLSSDSSSDVDLTPIVQQLSNINNKLQTTEIIDNTQKSITDVLNQQSNTIQVDEIGLLRSKKGYY